MAKADKTFDDCLAELDSTKRAALEKLRLQIRAAVPNAVEGVSYGLAAFRLDGKPLVAIGANSKNCTFYLMSNSTVKNHQDELKNYLTSTGTIHFSPDKPLTAAIVKKLVKARVDENNALLKSKKKPVSQKPKIAIKTTPKKSNSDTNVMEFIKEHPLKKELAAVRKIILGISPAVQEEIKWNSPSFRTSDFFATLNNARSIDRVRLILHTGAKVKKNASEGMKIHDPEELLEWLAKDRCITTFADLKEIKAKKSSLEAILKQWIKYL